MPPCQNTSWGKIQGLFKDFSRTLTTFAILIPAMIYHARERLWYHIKAVSSLNVALLTAVTQQVLENKEVTVIK